jgi:hypothetical protein
MPTARELRTARAEDLRDLIVHGHPVDPHAIEGWAYRGTSLGLPRVIERLTWKTFQKTFYRDPLSGRLVGWNVRLLQDGLDAASRPKTRDGRPVTEWNYEVIAPEGVPAPLGFDRGLLIDYGRAENPPGPVRITKDPLVALKEGSGDELLGVSYLVVGGRCIETPTYFTLEREHPIEFVPDEALRATSGARLGALKLTSIERAWAEGLFGAILGTGEGALPPFEAIDTAAFWQRFDEAPPPLVRAGLRPMLHTLTFLPVVSGFGRPFFRLAADERARFLEQAARHPVPFVRQAVLTLKTLACFAYFDDPAVRSRFEGAS